MTRIKKKSGQQQKGIIQWNTFSLGLKKSGEEHKGIIQWNAPKVCKFMRKQKGHN
jgi:hypothetical protein